MDNEEEGVLTKIRAANLMRLQGDDIGAREVYREAGDLLTRLYGEDFFYMTLYWLPSNLKPLTQDITQEVFLGAFRNLYKFDENLGKTLKQ
jgi:DNA-directed RNA polymerase specialized sigma24 family protein